MKLVYLIIILVFLAGCSHEVSVKQLDFNETIVVYDDAERGFSVGHPESWRLEEDEKMAAFNGPAYDMFISVTYEELYPNQSAEDYFKNAKKTFAEFGMEILKEDNITFANNDAYVIEYAFSNLQLKRIFIGKEDRVYEITCASDSSKFETMRKICSSSLSEFEFI